MVEKSIPDVRESDTVLRVLDRSAKITTRYGGGFVQSIDGVAGGTSGGRPVDWFFYVNGVESGRGSADFSLHGGDRIWWDYRDWGTAMRAPAVVGSFPEPFLHGYDGERYAADVRCLGVADSCGTVRSSLRKAGAKLRGAGLTEMEVLVGPWSKIEGDPAAAAIDAGPGTSGVFARFETGGRGYRLAALDPSGGTGRLLGAHTGLLAAVRRGEDPPTWVISGTDGAGVRAAAARLNAEDLHNHYALAVSGGRAIPLPLR